MSVLVDALHFARSATADLPVSIEVPSDRRAPARGYPAWAKAAVDAARRVLGDER